MPGARVGPSEAFAGALRDIVATGDTARAAGKRETRAVARCPAMRQFGLWIWLLVAHRGFEPLISALRGRCPRPLDECAATFRIAVASPLRQGTPRDR